MRRIAIYGVIVCALLLALPVATQEEEGNIARIVFYGAKPGMSQQLEDGVKKHMAWHQQQNDPWSWLTWEYISGPSSGMYGGGTFGRKWEDFDNVPVGTEADWADVQANILPYVAEGTVWRYYALLPKVSRPAEGEGSPAMYSIVTFYVRYGSNAEFNHLIGKFQQAIEKTNWPAHYEWYALVNGGQQPTYVLVLPRENWAAFKPLEPPFPAMLEKAYGRQEAESLLKRWRKVVRGQESEIIRTRPDLSYVPAGN